MTDEYVLEAYTEERLPLIMRWYYEDTGFGFFGTSKVLSPKEVHELCIQNGVIITNSFDSQKQLHPVGMWGIHSLSDVSRSGSPSCYLDKNLRGKKLSKELFQKGIEYYFYKQNMFRLWVLVRESNAMSIALAKSLGFVQEGIMRKHYFANGKFEDGVMLGLLKTDMKKR